MSGIGGGGRPARLYLDLLKGCLTRSIFETYTAAPITPFLKASMDALGYRVMAPTRPEPGLREQGRDWPGDGETMVGLARLDNIERCVAGVIADGVPGDLIETGVWRGGAAIFMRACLDVFGDAGRRVWVADSFKGLPRPDRARGEAPGAADDLWSQGCLAVSLEEVRSNFARYGLLDDRVRFLEGWFRDTLPDAPIDRLAVMRLDGDLYESTMDALRALYPKLSPGGYVIIDDYGSIPQCRRAVEEYRSENAITDTIEEIDYTGVYWRKGEAPPIMSTTEDDRPAGATGMRPAASTVIRLVGPGQRVLLIGGDEAVVTSLRNGGCTIVAVVEGAPLPHPAGELIDDTVRLDGGRPEVADREFDVIVVGAVPWLPDPGSVLAALRPSLAPGGYAVVSGYGPLPGVLERAGFVAVHREPGRGSGDDVVLSLPVPSPLARSLPAVLAAAAEHERRAAVLAEELGRAELDARRWQDESLSLRKQLDAGTAAAQEVRILLLESRDENERLAARLAELEPDVGAAAHPVRRLARRVYRRLRRQAPR